MAVSYANVDPVRMELTPMRVSFQGPGATAFTDLGGTLSNVVIDLKYVKAEIKADQIGTEPIDRRVKGLAVMITTEIAEVQDKDLWKIVFPPSTEAGTDPANTIVFASQIGDSDQALAGTLLLHPLSKGNTDLNYDFTAFKACASGESSITYGPDGQAKLKVVWNVLPDFTTTPPRYIMYGDRSLVSP